MIYLDNAATTRPCAEAVEAMQHALTQCWGNPSAGYGAGRAAKALLEESRSRILQALGPGGSSGTLLFTSGGTEADNQALKSGAHLARHRGKHIISSQTEHDAVLQSLAQLKNQGWEVTLLAPEPDGSIPTEKVQAALREDTALISLMLVNNETGAVTDIAGVRRILKAAGSKALLHTDAVQAFLKLPFSPRSLGADMISLSSHKIGGPKGAGALWFSKELRLPAFLHGGGQESGLRSGTEAIPAIAGFGAAAAAGLARWKASDMPGHYRKLKALLPELLPEAAILSGDNCADHIVSLSFPGARAEVLSNHLDSVGVCVSRGSACAKGRRSHVLEAMALPANVIDGALRISFSPDTTEEEIRSFCSLVREGKQRYFP